MMRRRIKARIMRTIAVTDSPEAAVDAPVSERTQHEYS